MDEATPFGGLSQPEARERFRSDVPHPARVYDALLGGKDNYGADSDAAKQLLEVFPDARLGALANRAFMRHIVLYLARAGITQFLDIGTGLPTGPNLHQVAQEVNPSSRVVYVDNDPVVAAHARALLVGTPQGRVAYVEADLAEPAAILGAPQLTSTLDLSQPVAVTLIAILHFLGSGGDDPRPYANVDTLIDAMAPGSYLVMSHVSGDFGDTVRDGIATYRKIGMPFTDRTRAQFTRFFDRMDLLAPGVVALPRCRPNQPELADPSVVVTEPDDLYAHLAPGRVPFYAGIARKTR